MTADGIRNL